MIPKKIHYCWFGGKELPVMARRCVESWKKYSPEYELVLWNESNSDIDNEYCRQATRQKNWAFISDWVRIDILHKHGGVYFDTDIELIRPLAAALHGDVLHAPLETRGMLGSGFIACAPGDPIMKRACDIILNNLIRRQVFVTSPRILQRAIDDTAAGSKAKILPLEVFYPFNPFDTDNPNNAGQLLFSDITPETVGIHHFSSSWDFKKQSRLLAFVKKRLKIRSDWRLTIDF